MRRRVLLVTIVIVSTLSLAPVLPPVVAPAQSGCGLKPLKPLTPLGCKDLAAQCRCDSNGRNCRWEWVCVK